ncbi:MAG: PadR family transcriptional regulator [Bacteroidales bacterium]|uniref:PadR family transcriptional regulator n=1 Tax=Porphyromonas sp. TaxID=1924944 RepID=UPI00297B5620|nr:PadR family transcriptional regulator [Porphyromonas sp.]MDD7438526.1 PadR family transcriptional regulator [Bacteroidales bacterium]MDY3067554.1 PadR family transcriptional regulator [Porphyromonas sp.]
MQESLEKTKSQMRKGIMEYAILLILRHREAYSVDLIEILKQNDLMVVEGTIYPLLTRLRKEGLIKYTWVESTQGPPRKYYVITESGRSYLDELRKLWMAMRDSVDLLDSDTPTWGGETSRTGLEVVEGEYIISNQEDERMIMNNNDESEV